MGSRAPFRRPDLAPPVSRQTKMITTMDMGDHASIYD